MELCAGESGPIAAMMILVGHVQSHLLGNVDRGHVYLLFNPVGGGKMIALLGENESRTEVAKNLQGCYLHFHRQKGIWIRSGKATGQPFEDRLGQHDKGAKLRDEISLASNFYAHYPSKEAQIITLSAWDSMKTLTSIVGCVLRITALCLNC
jgi:hypothetical protein